MELSKKQKEIVESTEDKIIVIASAASGKTRILTERAKWIIDHGGNPNKMALITFTNTAAEVMRERIGEKGNGMFIGTVHSLANYFLKSSGIDANEYIQQEKFDKLFELVKKNQYCIKQLDYILLDEAQDTDENQFEFILDMINPKKFFIVGDHRQLIYSFSMKKTDCFINLAKNKEIKVYSLNENYRNGSNILSFAKRIIEKNGQEYIDNSIPMSKEEGIVVELEYAPNKIIKLIERDNEYKNWFILTRSNRQLEEIIDILNKAKIPCDTFKQADFSAKELNEIMNKNSVKVLTIHSSKGLEADNVMVIGSIFYKFSERMVNYVAATRAKKKLYWFKNKPNQKTKIDVWE